MLEIFSLINSKRSGIGLLELLIAIVILTIPLTMIFKQEKSDYKIINEQVREISDFFQRSFSNAIFNQKIYEVRFFFTEKMLLSKITSCPHEKSEIDKDTFNISVDMKNQIKIKKLIINGKNELDSTKIRETWVLIYPEGYIQEIEIHLESLKDKIYNAYQINPFNCNFKFIL